MGEGARCHMICSRVDGFRARDGELHVHQARSEEHTSELQSPYDLVCRLLLEKKKTMLTVPATYPPEPACGVMVSSFDRPLATAIDGSFVHPRALSPEIHRAAGRVSFAAYPSL